MKSLFVSLLFIVTAPAFAQYQQNDNYDSDVEYISWCSENNVLAYNNLGKVYVAANCSEQNLVCAAKQVRRMHSTIVTATCQAQ